MNERGIATKYVLVAVAAVAIVVAVFVAVQHRRAQPKPLAEAPMTAAEKAYASNIQIVNPAVSAASNFLGANVYYLDGEIANRGPKDVRALDLTLTFMDPFGEVLSRRTEHVVVSAGPPLKAGASIPLHLIFEHVPDAWNQAPPVITPSYLKF